MSFMTTTDAGKKKQLDFERTRKKAKGMTVRQLLGAIRDCRETIKAGVDEGYYRDELSVYEQELKKR